MIVRFEVPGEPGSKGRPRFATLPNGKKRTYTPQKTINYENRIQFEYSRQCKNYRFPDDVGIVMNITAYLYIPKSTSKKKLQQMLLRILRPLKKPDCDNIAKVVSDALNGQAYHDDSHIVRMIIDKVYGVEPKVVVEMHEFGGTYEDCRTDREMQEV